VLVDPPRSLAKQAHQRHLPYFNADGKLEEGKVDDLNRQIALMNLYNNSHGLGLVWYTKDRVEHILKKDVSGSRPIQYRTLSTAMLDPAFGSICASTSSTAVLAHIRYASPGSAVTVQNVHPFVFGRWSMAHNGDIPDFTGSADVTPFKKAFINQIGAEALANVKGTGDSEHFAALLFTNLAKQSALEGGPVGADAWNVTHPVERVKRALRESIYFIIKTRHELIAPDENLSISLNLVITDGEKVVSVRYRNFKFASPTLYYTTSKGIDQFEWGNKDREPYLIIASEETTNELEGWTKVKRNECISYEVGDIEPTKEIFHFPAVFNGVDYPKQATQATVTSAALGNLLTAATLYPGKISKVYGTRSAPPPPPDDPTKADDA